MPKAAKAKPADKPLGHVRDQNALNDDAPSNHAIKNDAPEKKDRKRTRRTAASPPLFLT